MKSARNQFHRTESGPVVLGAATNPGFTLLEMLVMILLLVSGAAWGLQANFTGLKLAAQTHSAFLAVKGVQEYYQEYLQGLGYSGLALCASCPFQAPALPSSGGTLLNGSGLYWVEDVSPVSAPDTLKRVTVQVTWTDPDGRLRTAVASTLISK